MAVRWGCNIRQPCSFLLRVGPVNSNVPSFFWERTSDTLHFHALTLYHSLTLNFSRPVIFPISGCNRNKNSQWFVLMVLLTREIKW